MEQKVLLRGKFHCKWKLQLCDHRCNGSDPVHPLACLKSSWFILGFSWSHLCSLLCLTWFLSSLLWSTLCESVAWLTQWLFTLRLSSLELVRSRIWLLTTYVKWIPGWVTWIQQTCEGKTTCVWASVLCCRQCCSKQMSLLNLPSPGSTQEKANFLAHVI